MSIELHVTMLAKANHTLPDADQKVDFRKVTIVQKKAQILLKLAMFRELPLRKGRKWQEMAGNALSVLALKFIYLNPGLTTVLSVDCASQYEFG